MFKENIGHNKSDYCVTNTVLKLSFHQHMSLVFGLNVDIFFTFKKLIDILVQ